MTTFSELAQAQSRAASLFQAIREVELIRPGQTEDGISRAISALARDRFGVEKHWHRRVIRSGPNTRLPFRELPPDRTVEEDDIVSVDLGPVFGTLEADFGRTFVLGSDPQKHRLCGDLRDVFDAARAFFVARPQMSGAELHARVLALSAERGWGFGGSHAGHLIDSFPMTASDRDAPQNRIRGDNTWPMNGPGLRGEPRHWVLEVHLLDPTGAFGGFFEELLVPVSPDPS